MTSSARPASLRAETAFAAAALVAYALVTAVTAWHHEPWRDEADAWLIARDASVPELFRLTESGSPALWYLLLMPLAKLGLPYGSMHVLHLAIAWAAAAVLLFRAPFSRALRLLIAFSYFVLCEYAVVARSYALTMLLLFVLAALWGRRFERPFVFAAAVALLANANAPGLFLAAAVGAVYAWDLRRLPEGESRRGPFVAAGLMLAGGLAAAAQLMPHGGQMPGWSTVRHPQAPIMVLALLFVAPSPLAARIGDLRWLALAAVAALLAGWIPRPRLIFQVLVPTAALLYVFAFKWASGPRHAGLIFLLLVFALWVERLEPAPAPAWARAAGRLGRALFALGLAASVWAAAEFVRLEIRHPYSHAARMAEHLRAGGLAARPLATTVLCEAVVPYLPRRPVYYADAGRWGTHRVSSAVDDVAALRPAAESAARARRALPAAGGWLLLLHEPLREPMSLGFRPLHATRGPTGPSGERFFLYQALPALEIQ
ncbi:MAG TPA: hypothetical protein VF121_15020 [Thermoanaerobaculia bacterium]|nr:hypothetical protein [Thermoanaerobaculia bacterium]